jgi:endonuclease/exonuclease/phosphatase (EEP) superfamily protein YafD
MRMLVAWLLAAGCAGWAALRLLGLERGYPLVPLVAYTPFVVAAAVAVVVVAALLRQRTAALVAGLVAVALAAVVAPRALGGPSSADGAPGPRLRVLTANMHFGTGSATALVALARSTHADVLSVQELTPGLVRELDAAGLGDLMPHYVLSARDGGHGTGLYARMPLKAGEGTQGTLALMVAARPRIGGAPAVEIVAVHPSAPQTPARVGAWRHDLNVLPPAANAPLRILAGDFNATLDHAELRDVIGTGYVDAAAQVGEGLRPTWPQGRRFPPPVTIDHVLVDHRIGVRAVSVHPMPGTDHRAVFAELQLPRDGGTVPNRR